MTGPFVDKIWEWIDRSQGRIRADRVHAKLAALGYQGSERTTRRVVRELKARWRRENGPGVSALDPRAGLVAAVGLWRRPEDRWRHHGAVLRLDGSYPGTEKNYDGLAEPSLPGSPAAVDRDRRAGDIRRGV